MEKTEKYYDDIQCWDDFKKAVDNFLDTIQQQTGSQPIVTHIQAAPPDRTIRCEYYGDSEHGDVHVVTPTIAELEARNGTA